MDVIDLSEDVSDGISGMGNGGTIDLVDSMGPTGFASRRKRKRRQVHKFLMLVWTYVQKCSK